MATFLELCQAVARDSGTVPTIGDPQTTTAQTGRLARIVNWVSEAHEEIQRTRRNWGWMQAEFTGETLVGTQRYAAANMGIASRFSHWVMRGDSHENTFTIYRTSDGQAKEGYLRFIDWPEFRRDLMVGEAATRQGEPTHFTIDRAMQLVFFPIPDAAYTVRGLYQKAPQTLALDADTPEMPVHFHDIIKWRALILLGTFDEAFEQLPLWGAEYQRMLHALEIDQLPEPRWPEALA